MDPAIITVLIILIGTVAQLGFAKVLVKHTIRKIHDDGVIAHLIRGPYIMFFRPTMEESGWRSFFS